MTIPPAETTIETIAAFLEKSTAVLEKASISRAYLPAEDTLHGISRLGDDCAAIPDGEGGYLLFAGEAMQPRFVEDDPWFAGYTSVMVNISDICSMGGRPTAVVDMLWTPDFKDIAEVWKGMRAAAHAYSVPIVGGHTTMTKKGDPVYLATSILGRASTLMTSFDAQPGQQLLLATDLNGKYRRGKPFWNASEDATPERLQTNIALLPSIAEQGWCNVCKDISNGGIVGTLIMLLECSGVGARLDLDAIPKPSTVELLRWLLSFPSYGYLFAVNEEHCESIIELFKIHDIACDAVGEITHGTHLEISLAGESAIIWSKGV